jgi:MurNAc alpha-1-phosphate uridylyltransferase
VLAQGARRLTYSGIGRFRAELFAGLAPGVRALRPVLDASIAAGRVTGEHHTGTWVDVGTPERLQQLNRMLAHGAPR